MHATIIPPVDDLRLDAGGAIRWGDADPFSRLEGRIPFFHRLVPEGLVGRHPPATGAVRAIRCCTCSRPGVTFEKLGAVFCEVVVIRPDVWWVCRQRGQPLRVYLQRLRERCRVRFRSGACIHGQARRAEHVLARVRQPCKYARSRAHVPTSYRVHTIAVLVKPVTQIRSPSLRQAPAQTQNHARPTGDPRLPRRYCCPRVCALAGHGAAG